MLSVYWMDFTLVGYQANCLFRGLAKQQTHYSRDRKREGGRWVLQEPEKPSIPTLGKRYLSVPWDWADCTDHCISFLPKRNLRRRWYIGSLTNKAAQSTRTLATFYKKYEQYGQPCLKLPCCCRISNKDQAYQNQQQNRFWSLSSLMITQDMERNKMKQREATLTSLWSKSSFLLYWEERVQVLMVSVSFNRMPC